MCVCDHGLYALVSHILNRRVWDLSHNWRLAWWRNNHHIHNSLFLVKSPCLLFMWVSFLRKNLYNQIIKSHSRIRWEGHLYAISPVWQVVSRSSPRTLRNSRLLYELFFKVFSCDSMNIGIKFMYLIFSFRLELKRRGSKRACGYLWSGLGRHCGGANGTPSCSTNARQ